jgi:TetR/AcrR family transcriptional regulator, transcriptional repressor for nem operon
MKVSRKQVEQHRERIVAAAARLYREHGFEGVSVAEIMREAGLTHGAFYGHFESKDALISEALAHAGRQRRPAEKASSFVDAYLSTRHRDDRAHGCPIAALGSELARGPPAPRHTLTPVIRREIARLEAASPGATPAERRRAAIAAYSAMVGALLVSRVVDDPVLSEEILSAARAAIDLAATRAR